MSHAALPTRSPARRAPARWHQAVRAELRVQMAGLSGGWLGLLFLFMATGIGYDREGADIFERPFGIVSILAAMMFFFPLAFWFPAPRTPALPMGRVRLELIRVACGAAFAAGILGVSVCLHTAALVLLTDSRGTVAGFPAWYPLSLFIAGMASYLLGAAVTLRAERPGRALPVVASLGLVALSLAGVGLETTEYSATWNEDGTMTRTASTALTIPSALLRLGLSGIAVALAVSAGHASDGLRWRLRNPLGGWAPAPRARVRPPPAALRVPRAQAPLPAIAMRQFVVLAPRMAWLLPFIAFLAWRLWAAEISAASDTPAFITDINTFGVLYLAASLWPALVWMGEHHESPWDAVRPAGAVVWRLLHAAAGMGWLLIAALLLMAASVRGAMSAGTLGSPAELPVYLWLGLPIATLVMYCLGTVMIVLSDRIVLTGILGAVWVIPVMLIAMEMLLGGGLGPSLTPVSPIRVLAPIGWTGGEDWSIIPVLLWTPLCLAAAVGAICLQVWRERRGGYLDRRTIARLAWSSWRRRRAVPAR